MRIQAVGRCIVFSTIPLLAATASSGEVWVALLPEATQGTSLNSSTTMPDDPILALAMEVIAGHLTREEAVRRLRYLNDTHVINISHLKILPLKDLEVLNPRAPAIYSDLLCEADEMRADGAPQFRFLAACAVTADSNDRVTAGRARDRLVIAITLPAFHKAPEQIQTALLKLLDSLLNSAPYEGKQVNTLVEALETALASTPPGALQPRARLEVHLARAYQLLETPEKANEKSAGLLLSALTVFTAASYPHEHALAQENLGFFYASRGRHEEAVQAFTMALKTATIDSDREVYGYSNLNLGDSLIELGRSQEAIVSLKAALAAYTVNRSPDQYAEVQVKLCKAYNELKVGNRAANLRSAASACQEALRLLTNKPNLRATTLLRLGSTYQALAKYEEGKRQVDAQAASKRFYDDAVAVFSAVDRPRDHAMVLAARLIEEEHDAGKPGENARLELDFEKAIRLLGTHDQDIRATLSVRLGMARLENLKGAPPAALSEVIGLLENGARLSHEANLPIEETVADWELGEALSQAARRDEALKVYERTFNAASDQLLLGLADDWPALAELVDRSSTRLADAAIANGDNVAALAWTDAARSVVLAGLVEPPEEVCTNPACVTLAKAREELRLARKAMTGAVIFTESQDRTGGVSRHDQLTTRLTSARSAFDSARIALHVASPVGPEDQRILSAIDVARLSASEPQTAFIEFSFGGNAPYALVLFRGFGPELVKIVPLTVANTGRDALLPFRNVVLGNVELSRDLFLTSTGAAPRAVDPREAGNSHEIIPTLMAGVRESGELRWEDAFWYWHLADRVGNIPAPPGFTADDWQTKTQTYAIEALEGFQDSLASTTSKADSLIGQPIAKIFGAVQPTKLVLVPSQDIRDWPFSALPSLARFDISFSPSLRIYQHNRRLADHHEGGVTFPKIVANPTDDLHCAGVEGRLVEAAYPGTAKALYGKAATGQAVLTLFADDAEGHTTEWFISAHASYDPQSAEESGIQMADRTLTVKELFAGDWPHTQLAVISGCETSLGGFGTSDAWTLSLPAALTVGGIPRVLASTWRVDELATLLLIDKFTDLHIKLGDAAALHRAQDWLRSLNGRTVNAAIDDLTKRLPTPLNQDAEYCLSYSAPRFQGLTDTDHPFAHPYFWAGFVLYE